jgi:hypothetical protein
MDKLVITYKKDRIKEFYSPYISFSESTKIYLDEYFIAPKIKPFLEKHQIEGGPLNSGVILSDVMFKDIELGGEKKSYFYDEIVGSISRDSKTGQLVHKPMYSITFSSKMAPLTCPQTNVQYGCIKLYTKPVFYYIYFNLTDVVDFLEESSKK